MGYRDVGLVGWGGSAVRKIYCTVRTVQYYSVNNTCSSGRHCCQTSYYGICCEIPVASLARNAEDNFKCRLYKKQFRIFFVSTVYGNNLLLNRKPIVRMLEEARKQHVSE
jgi:hypothetical protein